MENSPAASQSRASPRSPCSNSASPISAATSLRGVPARRARWAATSAAMPSPRDSAAAAARTPSSAGTAAAAAPSVSAATAAQKKCGSGLQIIMLEQVVERRPADPEQTGRVRDVALAPRQRMADDLAIGPLARAFQIEHVRIVLGSFLQIEIGRGDQLAVGHYRRAL